VAEADHFVEDGVVRKESWRTASAPSSARSSAASLGFLAAPTRSAMGIMAATAWWLEGLC
jgi:hypothetical protein